MAVCSAAEPIVGGPLGCGTYYIDEIVFTDDPLRTSAERERHENKRGGSGVTSPTRDAAGVWKVVRDIQLGLNIPSYPGCPSLK